MKVLEGVLKEELARLSATEKSYRRELRKLPKGSIQKKRIKGSLYVYLSSRENEKVVTHYLGRMPAEELKKLEQDVDLRRKYERLLREVKNNQQRIAKMVRE